jgi:hypothetical protein
MTPGELCTATAKILGFEANAVSVAWRTLRQHGEVTSGGRGRSAAHCNSSDVATLLIALLGKLPSKSLMESWEVYCNLRQITSSKLLAHPAPVTPELDSLTAGHSFREAFSGLIASAASGTLQTYLKEGQLSIIRVRFKGPRPSAFIDVYHMKGKRAYGLTGEYVLQPEIADPWERLDVVEREYSRFPLHQQSELDFRGISRLGELLRRPQ